MIKFDFESTRLREVLINLACSFQYVLVLSVCTWPISSSLASDFLHAIMVPLIGISIVVLTEFQKFSWNQRILKCIEIELQYFIVYTETGCLITDSIFYSFYRFLEHLQIKHCWTRISKIHLLLIEI